MRKYKTIIWDMDGTLLDTLDDLSDSVNAALREFQLPEKEKIEVRSYVGNGILRLMELCVPGGKLCPEFEKIFLFFKTHYAKNSRNKTKPYGGLERVLHQLKIQGYQMAIVSNKADYIVKELAQLFFQDTIDIAIGESVGINKKPNPDTVFEAMRLLNANKETTIYIGDSEVDITTAKNAGIDCLSVAWGFRDNLYLQISGATHIIDKPKEILEYLENN